MPRNVEELVNEIRRGNDETRTAAWFAAGPLGAPAVKPLARLMGDGNLEVARAATHGLWRIVRHSTRPGGASDRVAAELLDLLDGEEPAPVRREVLWMLSEIGGEGAVPGIARALEDPAVREDARCALERIPGEQAIGALRQALKTAPADFKQNIVQSLRARGVVVKGFPCRKLQPVYTSAGQAGG
jgi:HEAT repeat protein